MKVITMDEGSLRYAVKGLLGEIRESGFAADAVVGVARGGVVIARILAEGMGVDCLTIKRQRPSTKVKTGGISRKLIMALPVGLINGLRILESLMLRLRLAIKGVEPVRSKEVMQLEISEENKKRIATARRILVVDDAVDSGKTLRIVLEFIKRLNPGAEVKSAVLTCTQPVTADLADWAIYRNGTLVRCPWTEDYVKFR